MTLRVGGLVVHRVPIIFAVSVGTALIGTAAFPFPHEHPLLWMIAARRPGLVSSWAYAYSLLWCTTTFLVLTVTSSVVGVLRTRGHSAGACHPLPTYPSTRRSSDLFVVLGEQHRRTVPTRAISPRWLVVPERGLYTGIAIVGAIGSGKTSACMYPYVRQLLEYASDRPACRIGGLVLEVKGDFCEQVRGILERAGRADDYVEVSLTSRYRYNPLHNDLDAYALAFGIATLMTNLFGRGKEPFWQQASTNLVKFVILLYQILNDYVTLFEVYEGVINPDKLRAGIAAGETRFGAGNRRIAVKKREHLFTSALAQWTWHDDETGADTWTYWSQTLEDTLESLHIPWRVDLVTPDPREVEKQAQFEAVKRWFENDWMRIEPKLRTSIVEGISVFLSLFDDNPAVKYTFCPPKDVYLAHDGSQGVALPPLADLIEQGKVVALNFPAAMNPGLARALGTMLKQDFQRAVLNRVHRMSAEPDRPWRPVLFLCDEYQAFATSGEHEPSGDEKFFSLARQARCIPIVATQSISSLRTVLPGESWRTLLQGLRTKIFLTLSDDFSAKVAADLCGKAERLKPGYTLTEAGQDARVSLMTGRPAAHRATVSAAKTYTLQMDYVFEPRIFAELKNAQAIVLAYDGANPLPATYCYLKPHYLNVQTSYFDQVAAGAL